MRLSFGSLLLLLGSHSSLTPWVNGIPHQNELLERRQVSTTATTPVPTSTTTTSVGSNTTTTTTSTTENNLLFNISTGGYDNTFYRDSFGSYQILIPTTNSTPSSNTSTSSSSSTPEQSATSGAARFLVVTPAGNSGALMYFLNPDSLTTNSTTTSSMETTTATTSTPSGDTTANTAASTTTTTTNAATAVATPATTSPTPAEISLSMDQTTLQSIQSDYNQSGITGELELSGEAVMGVAIVGAVRAIRDYTEGNGLMHQIFNYTLLPDFNTTSFTLFRPSINGTITYSLYMKALTGSFTVTPNQNVTIQPQIQFSSGTRLQWTFLTNETTVQGLSTESLFLSADDTSTTTNMTSGVSSAPSALQLALQGLQNGTKDTAKDVSFLTYAQKFTAGGWRFLTFFGRDTLISTRLLMPLLSSSAIEDALGATIERTNITGALTHEETIGDYASFVNIGNNMSYLGRQTFLDYKMIDTDLLSLPALSHYLLETPQGKNRSRTFLHKTAALANGTQYYSLLIRNVDYNMHRAAPFVLNQTYSNLIRLRAGQPVGNWRDSNQGLGYGVYPFDVNTALMPAALRSIAALSAVGIIDHDYEANATRYAEVWEQNAERFFVVPQLNATEAEMRLDNYVRQANLSNALLNSGSEGSAGSATPLGMVMTTPTTSTTTSTVTTATGTPTSAGAGAILANGPVNFYALSLMEDGTPVEVMNSDLGFKLLYSTNVSASIIQAVVEAMKPFPRGLLTNVGMVVANPAYDTNTTNIEVLNNGAYHGTVIWSFQQALMAAGMARQLSYCDNTTVTVDYVPPPLVEPVWCTNTSLVQQLKQAQTALWNSINGAKEQIDTEVWSLIYSNMTNSFTVANLATLSPEGTESDAIQLWSYGFLALADPTASSTTTT